MTRREGPRPPAIRWFVVLFLAGAALGFADALRGLDAPGITEAGRDAAIVGGSVRLTVALMTAGLVWLFAVRIARWLVPGFLVAKIGATLFEIARAGSAHFVSPLWLAGMALGTVAAALLFTPGGRAWFAPARGGSGDAPV